MSALISVSNMSTKLLRCLVVVFTTVCLSWGLIFGNALAQEYPLTEADPRIDGQFTNAAEYASADTIEVLGECRWGKWYYQNKVDWAATSSSENTAVISGVTVFIMHDIRSAMTEEVADYNTFIFTYDEGAHTAKVWIFAGDDKADDSDWIGILP